MGKIICWGVQPEIQNGSRVMGVGWGVHLVCRCPSEQELSVWLSSPHHSRSQLRMNSSEDPELGGGRRKKESKLSGVWGENTVERLQFRGTKCYMGDED